jgi:hypothetical protein
MDAQRERPHEKVLDSGYFDGPTFSDLLGVVFRKRVTGTLHVTRANAQTTIHFKQGIPAQVAGAPSRGKSPTRGPKNPVESTVKYIFSWFGGAFRLVEAPGPSEVVEPPPNVLALIYEGSACFSPAQLRGIAFRLDGVVLPRLAAKRVPAELALGAAERKLLTAIDGKCSIGRVLRTAPGADLAGVRLLYALHCTEQSASGLSLSEEPGVTPAESPRRSSAEVDHQAPAPTLGLADTARLLAAEGSFHRAKALIERNDFKAAHAELLEATRLDGDEGDYRAYLGWTHFRISRKDPVAVERALGELEKALALNPQNGKAYLFRGYIREATGDLTQARSDFERALQSSVNSPEALDALLRMNARVA